MLEILLSAKFVGTMLGTVIMDLESAHRSKV